MYLYLFKVNSGAPDGVYEKGITCGTNYDDAMQRVIDIYGTDNNICSVYLEELDDYFNFEDWDYLWK